MENASNVFRVEFEHFYYLLFHFLTSSPQSQSQPYSCIISLKGKHKME